MLIACKVMEGMVAGLEWVTALNYNPFFNSSFRAEQFTAPDLSSNVVPVSLPLVCTLGLHFFVGFTDCIAHRVGMCCS